MAATLKLNSCFKKGHFSGCSCCACKGTRVASTIFIWTCLVRTVNQSQYGYFLQATQTVPFPTLVTNCLVTHSPFSSLIWQPIVPKPNSHLKGHRFSLSLRPAELLLCLCHMGAPAPLHLPFDRSWALLRGYSWGPQWGKRGHLPLPFTVGKDGTPAINNHCWFVAIFCKPVKWAALSSMPSEIWFLQTDQSPWTFFDACHAVLVLRRMLSILHSSLSCIFIRLCNSSWVSAAWKEGDSGFVHSVKTGFPQLIAVGFEIFPLKNKEFGTQSFCVELGGTETGLCCYYLSSRPPLFIYLFIYRPVEKMGWVISCNTLKPLLAWKRAFCTHPPTHTTPRRMGFFAFFFFPPSKTIQSM